MENPDKEPAAPPPPPPEPFFYIGVINEIGYMPIQFSDDMIVP